MDIHHLVRMANDIAHFYAGEPDREEAVNGVASHLKRFWDPRMRRQIIEHLAAGGEGLEDLAREAVGRLPMPPQQDKGAALPVNSVRRSASK
jgi:formate dehydrogenase subunit delta